MSLFLCDGSQQYVLRINVLRALKFLQRTCAGAAYITQECERKPNIHPSKSSYLNNQSEFHKGLFQTRSKVLKDVNRKTLEGLSAAYKYVTPGGG